MPEIPPTVARKPAAAPAAPLTLRGEGLEFTVESLGDGAVLLPQNAASTTFLVARSAGEKADLEGGVQRTQDLLSATIRLAASAEVPPDTPEGVMARDWRAADQRDGAATQVTVLGVVPNWVDRRGGTVAFVRITRPKGSGVSRMYWNGSKMVGLGGGPFPNPAPMRLMEIGLSYLGAWSPALGRFADFVLQPPALGLDGAKGALITAGGRTVKLIGGTAPPAPN